MVESSFIGVLIMATTASLYAYYTLWMIVVVTQNSK